MDSFRKMVSSPRGDERADLSKKVKAHPEDPQLRQKYGALLLKNGELSEGIEQLAAAASLYEKSGFDSKALAVLRQILKHDSDNIDHIRSLIRLLARQGLVADAIQETRRVSVGRAGFSSDDQRIDFLRHVAEHMPANPLPILLVADILRSKRKLYEAVTEMEKAAPLAERAGLLSEFAERMRGLVAAAGQNLDVLEACGFLWLHAGRVEEGTKLLMRLPAEARRAGDAARADEMERVLGAIPKLPALWKAVSFQDAVRKMSEPAPPPAASRGAGEDAAASDAGEEAPLPEETPGGEAGAGTEAEASEENLVRNAVGRLQEKINEEIGDSDLETRYNLGIAYKEMGLLDEAMEEFRLSRKSPKFFIGALAMMASILSEKGDTEAAVNALDELLASGAVKEVQARDILYQKGLYLEKAGREREAADIFLALYREAPDYRDVRARAGKKG